MISRLTCTFGQLVAALAPKVADWRLLSHPNVLPVLGTSPKLFPLCIVSEWMINGNIMIFAARYCPEINRLRLVRSIVSPSILGS